MDRVDWTKVSEPANVPNRELPAVDVQAVLKGQSEVRLIHRGETYRLRITKQGKLILTK